MEDGFFDDPNSDSHGRSIVALMPNRLLGSHGPHLSRKEILLSFNGNNCEGNALVPSNRDKGNQGT